MDTLSLKAEPRSVFGKKVKALRRVGLVPANLYGHRRASVAIQLPEKLVTQRLARASGSSLFSLELDGGQPETVLVKELQKHPISGQVLHVDFYLVAMTEKLRATVPLHFVGEAPAVKKFDGTMIHNMTSVDVESLPSDLPSGIEVDVSGMATLEDAIHVSDLRIPGNVQVLAEPDEMVARVLPPRVMEEVEEEAEEAATVEQAAAAEEEQATQPTAEGGETTSE